MSNKYPDVPVCACRKVKYDPMRLPDGTNRDRWRCLRLNKPDRR